MRVTVVRGGGPGGVDIEGGVGSWGGGGVVESEFSVAWGKGGEGGGARTGGSSAS